MKLPTQKFSYSKLNTYAGCGYKYRLTYVDKHFSFSESLAASFGTLVHHIEETIGNLIKAHQPIDYNALVKEFHSINIPKRNPFDTEGGIFGIDVLKEKYKEEFFAPDKEGSSYNSRAEDYIISGIYRLEEFFKANPNIEVFDTEKFFSINYHGAIFSGFIDRIFYDRENDLYIVEDIKTKHKPFSEEELVTPLQFVIYVQALSETLDIPPYKIKCAYDLPMIGIKQDAGTPGFLPRGLKKITELLDGISNHEFVPSPSPLCAWCPFSKTNKQATGDDKFLCPYHSKWTPEQRTFKHNHEWEGAEKDSEIVKIERLKAIHDEIKETFDFDF